MILRLSVSTGSMLLVNFPSSFAVAGLREVLICMSPGDPAMHYELSIMSFTVFKLSFVFLFSFSFSYA